jgi:hypothetical protein
MTTQTPVAEPFSVASRAKAQKLAKLLYGPNGRCFINQMQGVAVGMETGKVRAAFGKGKTFTEALYLPIETYLKGGKDYDATLKRLQQVAVHAEIQEFVIPALKQFPEYEAMLKAQRLNRDPGTILARLLAKAKRQEESAAEARKQLQAQAAVDPAVQREVFGSVATEVVAAQPGI